jgi:adenylate cyclase
VQIGEAPLPALSLPAAAAFLRRPRAYEEIGPQALLFAGRPIPIDDLAQTRINYGGPPSHRPELIGAPTVPGVSYVDVLNGSFDPAVVSGKTVLVGLTALGFADDYWAPTSRAGVKMTGVEIHAQAAEMLLQGSFLAQQGVGSTVLATLALSLLTGTLLARWQPVLAGLSALGCLGLYVLAALFYGWSSEQQVQRATTFTILNTVYPGVAMLGTTLAVLLYRIVFEQAEQRATRGAMGKYLSPSVLQEVLRDPAALRLGGQKREMTVLFSDIRGFTSLSEDADPEGLVHFLNEYLTAMTDVVFAQGGVLDKYMGDGIMAFWGAPSDQPDHALRACRAAYDMVHRLGALQEGWEGLGVPPLTVGIGINSGMMTVGNVGSKQRFDYTVVGDAVNLAARLEEANKEYRTRIIVGDETRRRVEGEFVLRSLDLVALRGLTRATAIFELLGIRPEADGLLPAGYLASWEEAVALYREGRYELAQARFERCLGAHPDDGPARIYLERCVGRVPLQEGITLPLVGQGGGRPVPGIEDRP